MKKLLSEKGSMLIVMLMTVGIIGIIYYLMMQNNKKTAGPNSNKAFIESAGVDTTSYKGTLDSTKKILGDAQATRAGN